MSFGPYVEREDRHGRWLSCAYDGQPGVQLFVPRRPDGNITLYWRGIVTPQVAAIWLKSVSAALGSDLKCVIDIWSDHPPKPTQYLVSNIGAIESDLTSAPSGATVTMDVRSSPGQSKFYVWGELAGAGPAMDSSEPKEEEEVGVKLSSSDLFGGAGKALVSDLLHKTARVAVSASDVTSLFPKLQSELALHT